MPGVQWETFPDIDGENPDTLDGNPPEKRSNTIKSEFLRNFKNTKYRGLRGDPVLRHSICF